MRRPSRSTTCRLRCSISTIARRAGSSFRASPTAGGFDDRRNGQDAGRYPRRDRPLGRGGRDRHSGRLRRGVAQGRFRARRKIIVDGTNSNTALIALGYVNQIVSAYAQDMAQDLSRRLRPAQPPPPTVTLEQRPWYNVDYNSRWFFVPGVIATLTLVMVVNLTSFAIVREREVGTLEQIMVTPIRPLEFILGKTIPFFCVGLALTAVIAGGRNAVVPGPVRRQSVRAAARHLALSLERAGDRPAHFDGLRDSAAGLRDQLLRHQPGLHPVRLQLSHLHHAACSCSGSRISTR